MSVDLRENDLETLRRCFARFPSIRTVRIFGSRAKKTARRASDIDLAIAAPDMTDRQWSELREALDNAPLIYGLDVIRIDSLADKKLRSRIFEEGVVIYQR